MGRIANIAVFRITPLALRTNLIKTLFLTPPKWRANAAAHVQPRENWFHPKYRLQATAGLMHTA
jgi:hypothetical protein